MERKVKGEISKEKYLLLFGHILKSKDIHDRRGEGFGEQANVVQRRI